MESACVNTTFEKFNIKGNREMGLCSREYEGQRKGFGFVIC